MNRFLDWWKMPGRYWDRAGEFPEDCEGHSSIKGYSGERKGAGEKRYVTLVKSLLLGLLPLLCCMVYCAGQGRGLGEVYIPSSEWNDELFYFKQVESILNFGYPQGYFGFNESHALKLSFAAWSPVLVFPWLIWGVVFGWNLMSPIYCNIFLVCLCCFLFVWLVRPTWKQVGVLTLLFCLYKPFVRYMLSAMAEVICFVVLIFFYSLAVNYLRHEKDYKLVVLFLVSGLMALMRPYLVLFMLLPIYFWIRRGKSRGAKWRNGAVGMAVLAAVLGIYVCINHYLGAEYFTPLFYTDWITAFFEEGLFGGIYFTLRKLYYTAKTTVTMIGDGFREGLASGAHFAGYLACMAVLAVQCLRDWRTFRRLKAETGRAVAAAGTNAERREGSGRGADAERREGPGRGADAERREGSERGADAERREGSERGADAERREGSGRGADAERAEGSGLGARREQEEAAEKGSGTGLAGRSDHGKTSCGAQTRRVWENLVIEAHLAFCFLAMFFAILLMYKLTEGSRHLLTFMAAALFVIALMDTKFYKKAVFVGVTFAYFYFYVPLDPFDYEIPFRQEERVFSLEAWTEAMAEGLVLEREDVPNYDNVVIWVFSDMVGEEEVRTSYQLLYGLPKGFGVSCCMRDFVVPNIDTLKSRYIAVPAYGEIAMLCEEREYSLVYGDDELALYELRGGE